MLLRRISELPRQLSCRIAAFGHQLRNQVHDLADDGSVVRLGFRISVVLEGCVPWCCRQRGLLRSMSLCVHKLLDYLVDQLWRGKFPHWVSILVSFQLIVYSEVFLDSSLRCIFESLSKGCFEPAHLFFFSHKDRVIHVYHRD